MSGKLNNLSAGFSSRDPVALDISRDFATSYSREGSAKVSNAVMALTGRGVISQRRSRDVFNISAPANSSSNIISMPRRSTSSYRAMRPAGYQISAFAPAPRPF